MSTQTKLFLELGDIIQINAPSNSLLDKNIYIINYLDNTVMSLIDDKTLEPIIININKGELSENIESIDILNKAEEKGYARQNNFNIGNWLSIHIGGDIPSIIIGQVTDLEEDMIEVTTWHENEKIYIDFAYKGLPLNIPFEKIIVRGPPPKSDLQEDEPIVKEVEEYKPEIEVRLKEELLQGDEIQFGNQLEEITEIINVPEEERRYDIHSQQNDMLDDMLSTVPQIDRTKKVINKIHIMIERFIQIRKKFSTLDAYGLPTHKKKISRKPLIDELLFFKRKIYWTLPIVKNKRKLYDVLTDDDDDFLDIDVQQLAENLNNITNLFDQYNENKIPDGQNKYNFLITKLKSFFTPVKGILDKSELLASSPVNDNLNVIVNNYDFLNSSVARTTDIKAYLSNISTGFGVIEKYILGLTRLFVERTKDLKLKSQRIQLTANDTIDLNGFIFFPYPIIHYNRINLTQTNILTRSNLNLTTFNYWSIIKSLSFLDSNKVRIYNVEDINKELQYSEFINNTKVITLKENLETEDKYKNFLRTIVPNVEILFNEIKHKIKNPLSFTKLLEYLELFMIYEENITYKDYKIMTSYLDEKIFEFKRTIHKLEKENNLYYNYNYKVKSKIKDIFIDETLRELYNLKTNNFSESFRQILGEDNGKIFMNYISIQDIDLHSTINIEEKIKANLENISLGPKDNPCKNYILTKEYDNMRELNNDDNNPNIFFDKKYDPTPYEIMSEFQLTKEQLSAEEFSDFLLHHLKTNVGMSLKDAEEEVSALLMMKRQIREGQYSILRDSGKVFYYERKNNKWILEESLNNKAIEDVFCNLQDKCLKVGKICSTPDVGRDKINKRLLKEILSQFDKELFYSKEELRKKLEDQLRYDIGNIQRLRYVSDYEKLKWDLQKKEIGFLVESIDVPISPYENLRDTILNQSNFVKKQSDIVIFVDKYCREDNIDIYWYFCVSTNVRLLPTFFKTLADAYKLGNYTTILDQVCRTRGTISDDGNNVVDKYSGYIIKSIEFDISEGYDEGGFKTVSREILKKDLGERIKFTQELNEYDTVNAKKVENIILTISEFMGISLLKEFEFIMNNVINSINNEKTLKNYKENKSNRKRKSFQDLNDEFLLYYTLAYILIAIQTAIPSVQTNKTFPGCKKSFLGWPLNSKGDLSALKYLACITDKIKSKIGPWRIILKHKESKIIKRLQDLLVKKILKKEHIKNKIKQKKESSNQDYIHIPAEHTILKWTTFLPPLHTINIPKVRTLGPGFESTFKNNIRLGNKSQFHQLSTIEGKIIYFSLTIQESIQNIIKREEPILEDMNRDPFLENVCCNDGLNNVLDYFMRADKTIDTNNRMVHKLNNLYYFFKNLSTASIYFDPTNTFMFFPKILNVFSEDTIYRAFLYYCNYSSTELVSDNLLSLCLTSESSILETDTFEEKVQKLKEGGNILTTEKLNTLLKIIGRNNFIQNKIDTTEIHPHQNLINILKHFETIDQTIIPDQLLNSLTSLTDSFDVLDWSEQGKEFNIVSTLKNYLFKINEIFKKKIKAFIKDQGSLRGAKLLSRSNFLDTLIQWKPKGENIYMDVHDETSFFIGNFLKEATKEITEVFPTILLNKIDYKNSKIPQHWGLSSFHKMDVVKMISGELKGFSSFFDVILDPILKQIKQKSKNLNLLMDNIPFFSKIGENDTIFDCSIYTDIMEFFFLTSLNNYIIFCDEADEALDTIKDLAGVDDSHHELDLVIGEKERLQQKIARLIIFYIDLFVQRKKILNKNNASIKENILKSKEKEKSLITKKYKDMTDEERKVEKLQQKHKLGDWNLGQTKALHKYSTEQFDKERDKVMINALEELKLGKNDEITAQLGEVLSMDDIHEMDMASRLNAQRAIQLSLLGDDDDHGENDGDERF